MRGSTLVTAVVMAAMFGSGSLAAQAVQAAPGLALGVQAGSGSVVRIEGGSNIHDWESRSSAPRLQLMRDSSAMAPGSAADLQALIRDARIRGLVLEVPVLTLHSKKSGLDKNLYKDLRADEHPVIRFTLDRYSVLTRDTAADTTALRAEGRLDVAGQERPVTVTGRVYRAEGGLWLAGSHPLRMTAFGIKPRTMMMGTLRVHDEVTVHYQILLSLGK